MSNIISLLIKSSLEKIEQEDVKWNKHFKIQNRFNYIISCPVEFIFQNFESVLFDHITKF